jgi:outer membrane protein assembly factor BamA
MMGRGESMKFLRSTVCALLLAVTLAEQTPAQERPKVLRSSKYEHFGGIRTSEIQSALEAKGVTLKVETPYDQKEIDRAKEVLTAMLAERGRPNERVEATVEPIPPRSVGVTFTVVKL